MPNRVVCRACAVFVYIKYPIPTSSWQTNDCGLILLLFFVFLFVYSSSIESIILFAIRARSRPIHNTNCIHDLCVHVYESNWHRWAIVCDCGLDSGFSVHLHRTLSIFLFLSLSFSRAHVICLAKQQRHCFVAEYSLAKLYWLCSWAQFGVRVRLPLVFGSRLTHARRIYNKHMRHHTHS